MRCTATCCGSRRESSEADAKSATMRIDVSLLPALAAAFLLVFARIGTMVMLMPGLGEVNIPTRIRLGIALALTLMMLPLHRSAYPVKLENLAPLPVL